MKTGMQILRDVEHTLFAICACGRQMCLACSRRKEVRDYLEIADGEDKRQPLEIAEYAKVSAAEMAARASRPPEEIVGALQDRVHRDLEVVRPAVSTRVKS